MRLGSRTSGQPTPEIVVIPRGDEDQIVFKAGAVLDFTGFKELVKEPERYNKMKPGGIVEPDDDNPKYKEALAKYSRLRLNWTIIQSLKSTEDLVWETVKEDDPDTWENYESELKLFGLTQYEINHIIDAIFSAQGISDKKLEEARKRFLSSQQNPPLVG